MSLAVLFPGQGSQFVGMGGALFDAYPDLLGERSDDILGWSLREMCLNGPDDVLTRTEHAQPALFAVSYALWLSVKPGLPTAVTAAAGHSLGEYTALAAAEALTYDDALAVVAARGRAMSEAIEIEPSGMAALIGADEEKAAEVVERNRATGGRLQVANINAPGQVVVAGSNEDMEWLAEHARDLGVRRAIPIKVAGAFHSSFMESAQAPVESALAQCDIGQTAFEVWANTTARPHEHDSIRPTLVSQVVSPVRFSESLQSISDAGHDTFLHVGPGDVTAGMARRTVKGSKVVVVSSLGDIPEAVEEIGTMA